MGNPLPVELQVLLTLRFYATGSFEKVIGDLFGVSEAATCISIHRVSRVIASRKSAFIYMPRNDSEMTSIRNEFFNSSSFPLTIGAVGGCHVRIVCPSKEFAQIFYNRKCFYSINVQVICDSKLLFRNIVARWPGSTHDARVFNNSMVCQQFESNTYGRHLLLGDSGYPCRHYLLTPVRNPSSQAEIRYKTAHGKARRVIERSFGVWKRRFPSLHIGLRTGINNSMTIIVATAGLHNLAIHRNERDDLFDEDPDLSFGNESIFLDESSAESSSAFHRRDALINTYFQK